MRLVKYEIRHNKRNKRFIVFEVPTKGRWTIKESFKTKKDAQDWVKEKTKSKKRKKRK